MSTSFNQIKDRTRSGENKRETTLRGDFTDTSSDYNLLTEKQISRQLQILLINGFISKAPYKRL